MIKNQMFLFFMLLRSVNSFLQKTTLLCNQTLSGNYFNDETLAYQCLDSGSAILHSDALNGTFSAISERVSSGWVQIRSGHTICLPHSPEPVSFCLSSTDGTGGTKSITNTDAIYFSTSGSLKLPLFGVFFFQYGLTPGFGLRVRLSRVVEYGCAVKPGETVQILKSFQLYSLTGWLFRPLIKDLDPNEVVSFGAWQFIPDTIVTEEFESIMCVTEEKFLQCQLQNSLKHI